MIEEKDSFYIKQHEPQKGCFLVLREIILNYAPEIKETVKYGMPCFTFKTKAFCYIWSDKQTKQPYILFVEGNYLEHKALEKGNRARMKILRIDANADIPIAIIHNIMEQAINLYHKGIIKVK